MQGRAALRIARSLILGVLVLALWAPSALAAPPSLSDSGQEDIDSAVGSGSFGRWTVDERGLPAYDYRLDQTANPAAAQPELEGDTANWSQLGNDAIVANAYNHGYSQLWSSQRLYQWANRYDEPSGHYAGGFGWLRLADGRAASTLYLDRKPGSRFERRFGVGYARKQMLFAGVEVVETTTAPFGDDPALVDEVRITNRGSRRQRLSWWEYWDVNPYDQTTRTQLGLDSPSYDADSRVLSAPMAPGAIDSDPLTIFLAAAKGPLDDVSADTQEFFGDGTRAMPQAVAADAAAGALAPPTPAGASGRAMFAMRSALTLEPGESRTLRYVYGIAHDDRIAAIADRASRSGVDASARRWARWMPEVDLGGKLAWLARELAWDAYMTRSSSLYEETCGHHVITQGGYYQYGLGQQIAYRDPLQHMLPMIYTEPELAREVLRYSVREQEIATGEIPYGIGPMCTPMDLGASNDMDFWLVNSLAEYVLATRDLDFLDERLPYLGGAGEGTVWDHVKLAVQHQENVPGRGPTGNYLMARNGDWSDFSTTFLPATESVLVTAQLAYAYPRLAEVADLRGDHEFAAELRALGARNLDQVRKEWTGKGWYARGYFNTDQVGAGAEYLEPQPWAVLAGAPDTKQARTLVANTERFLAGAGAPSELGGPTRIGTSQSPARNDPEVSETDTISTGVGDNNAVFVGGTWYALTGTLTWALAELVGEVPNAAQKAFDELKRNTLTAHAEAFPDHWTGVMHVDDACNSFYASQPEECGIGLLLAATGRSVNGQITHQPAWGLLSALRLAGIEPTGDGYAFAPVLPLKRYSIRLPRVGIASEPGLMRGYVRTESDAPMKLSLDPPAGSLRGAAVWVDGKRANGSREGDALVVTANPGADRLVDWAVRQR